MTDLPEGFPTPRCYSGVGPGWWPIIEALHKDLLILDPDYRVEQVKEKFGTLRYYAAFSEEKYPSCNVLVQFAEECSAKTCEECGEPGRLRTDRNWLKTYCDRCDAADDSQARLKRFREFVGDLGLTSEAAEG